MNLPMGFRFAATYAGIRKVAKDDVALIVSDRPAVAAAVFTQEFSGRRAGGDLPPKLEDVSRHRSRDRRECGKRELRHAYR